MSAEPARAAPVPTSMVRFNRKTTPKVRNGKVQRKNRTDLSRGWRHHAQERPLVERHAPGEGYRHVLLKRDVEAFLDLLPDWEELCRGLDAVLLARGEDDCMGWHDQGVVAVCAWERELAWECTAPFLEDHRPVLERLGVAREPTEAGRAFLHWTEPSGGVRAAPRRPAVGRLLRSVRVVGFRDAAFPGAAVGRRAGLAVDRREPRRPAPPGLRLDPPRVSRAPSSSSAAMPRSDFVTRALSGRYTRSFVKG